MHRFFWILTGSCLFPSTGMTLGQDPRGVNPITISPRSQLNPSPAQLAVPRGAVRASNHTTLQQDTPSGVPALTPNNKGTQSSDLTSPNDPSQGMATGNEGPQVPASIPTAPASTPPPPSSPPDPLLFQSGPLKVKIGLDAVVQPTGAIDSFWLLSKRFAPNEDFSPDRIWIEGWIKPGVRTDLSINERLAVYSGVSYVGSANFAKDLFDEGNRGLWAVEDAYFGVRYGDQQANKTIDISYGQQPYKIGSGMLISVGALNGFERGATTTFARRSWEEAAIARLNYGAISFDGFYLNPNELRSVDTFNQLAGGKLEYSLGTNQYIGLAYFNVFNSMLPYLAAPVRLIPEGREGLNTVHSYTRVNPFKDTLPGFYTAGDFAYQWNDGIDLRACAYSAEVGQNFGSLPFTPTLAYAYRYFSGDNPATTRFEKFDPLFYEGSPPLWSSGSNGSFAFLNSNVLLHRLSLAMVVTPKDLVNLYYWHVRADRVNSPLQFGQSTRIEVVGGEPRLSPGVPNSHLSDDFYAEYVRLISQNVFLTTGVGVSVPGKGLRAISGTRTWVGGLVNLTLKF